MKNISDIRRAAAAAALATSLLIPVAANAQLVVTDPAATQVLMGVAQMQAAMSKVQSSQFVKEASSEYQLVQQVQTMLKDHVDISSITKGAGNALVSSITRNTGLMEHQLQVDAGVETAFRKLVPSFDGTESYMKFLKRTHDDEFHSYAESLGVADDIMKNQADVQREVNKIVSAPAANQLQAIQQLVAFGKVQSGQMSDLLKTQTRMLKAIETSYASNSRGGFGQPIVANMPATSQAARQLCAVENPQISMMSPAMQRQLLDQCQADLPNKQ